MAEEKQYTLEELAEIGRRAVEYRRARQDKAKKARALKTQLYKLYQEGKIQLPPEQ
jgi:hypothetical protein